MGAIDNFLKRWGFAKLDRYGLVLTGDDRVITTRPVLDDGLGTKIVGWLEGDLAAMELEKWGAPKAATAKPVTAPASLHKLPRQAPLAVRTIAPAAPIPAPVAPAALPGVAPIAAPVAARTPIPTSTPAPAPVVAVNEEPGEDEWEWEIAMARARAAAEWDEEARVDLLGASAVIASPVISRKTNLGMQPVAAPKLPPSLREPEPLPPWPGTEPFNDTWSDKSEVAPQVMSPLQKKLAVERRTPARPLPSVTQPRSTVIPVPTLPSAADPRTVRPAPYTPLQPRGRAARGTGSPTGKLEDTVRTLAAPPVGEERTSPYITLPNEVKPSGFAHTKRVAAKER